MAKLGEIEKSNQKMAEAWKCIQTAVNKKVDLAQEDLCRLRLQLNERIENGFSGIWNIVSHL